MFLGLSPKINTCVYSLQKLERHKISKFLMKADTSKDKTHDALQIISSTEFLNSFSKFVEKFGINGKRMHLGTTQFACEKA